MTERVVRCPSLRDVSLVFVEHSTVLQVRNKRLGRVFLTVQKGLVWVASAQQVRCDCRQKRPREQAIGIGGTVGQSGVIYLTRRLHEHTCAIHTKNSIIAIVGKWRYLIE